MALAGGLGDSVALTPFCLARLRGLFRGQVTAEQIKLPEYAPVDGSECRDVFRVVRRWHYGAALQAIQPAAHQAERRFLPLSRRDLSTRRPPLVDMRARKP